MTVERLLSWNIISLRCRNDKAFCERSFALHGQQPEKR